MTTPTPSAAKRVPVTRWLNLRFVAGVVLVVAPIFIGARVLASADRYAEVYIARQALVPGEQVAASDIAVGRVRFTGQGAQYIAAGRAPVGYVVTRYVGAGELLPLAAVSRTASPQDETRLVTLPVPAGHAPTVLSRGDLVDVYVTPKSTTGDGGVQPRLVISAAPVESVSGSGALSSSATLSVVLAVPAGRVMETVKAVESGTIDIARVPAAAVAPGVTP